MTDSADNEKFERVARRIDPRSRLIQSWSLIGGASAQMTALEVMRADGQVQKLIVRQPGDGTLKQNPRAAADEFTLLQHLRSAGLATPTPYHLDQSGEIFPAPYLVIEYIEG